MKNVLILLFILFCGYPVLSAEHSCAGGQGIVIKGVNGQLYCASKVPMNWWSANAWCDSAEGVSRLVNPSQDCDCKGYDGCDTTVSCPNLISQSIVYAWTSAIISSDKAYKIHLPSGELERIYLTLRENSAASALCK